MAEERIVDGRCKYCFEVNPSMESDCDSSPSGVHKIEPKEYINTKHRPAGSPQGGEFAPKGGGKTWKPGSTVRVIGSAYPGLTNSGGKVVTDHGKNITWRDKNGMKHTMPKKALMLVD